ncbi:hypothetical protein [Paenibacillus ihumii]|uniref:hypothetical protein n=1 Tax=Paenibacillus ihumii TaxID=687436 RepID=UPI0006D7B901|nr:hypothetical protein [Paenibacillus ihumii]
MGTEAKYDVRNLVDDNNRFKYLFNMATGNHYIESENTPENASWAKGELLEIFERNAQIEESVKT